MYSKLGGAFDNLIKIVANFAGIVLVFCWIVICLDKIMVNFFDSALMWRIEVTEYSLMLITFLASAWILKNNGHIVVDILIQRAKPRSRALINALTNLLGGILSLFMVYFGIRAVIDSVQNGTMIEKVLQLPLWPILIIVPLSFFLLFVEFIRESRESLEMRKTSPSTKPSMQDSEGK